MPMNYIQRSSEGMSGSHLSKDFYDLVKAIGESKSKQEEDRIVIAEVGNLKKRLPDSSVSKKKMKEYLVRIMYVEMLGHDASFGYIKAVELCASTNLIQKRVGYLCASQTLSPTHEFRFMLINQLQRDLQSPNHLECCAALVGVAKLVTTDMIPAIQPIVVDLLTHDMEIVRKKAVMVLQRFHQQAPDCVDGLLDKVRRTLCDKDPSVMGASLCLFYDLVKMDSGALKDLVPSFVSILKQITEHRLPREFDYHRMPAPWIQIRLLRILACLGRADQKCSEDMYEVLHDVMRRADTGINVGYAIIYECVRTVTTIYPNTTLLDASAAAISRFISSDNHNLKYLGVTGLASIVEEHPRYAAEHQMAVLDCLEDPDETLKRKTLDLLFRMTNPVNVEIISEKLLQFLRSANDDFLRTDLVQRITKIAERYAPNNEWYIRTMTTVFELGGDLVRSETAHNLMRLIAEGSGEDDEEADAELRRGAVVTFMELLPRVDLPDVLLLCMCWVLGEYSYLAQDVMPLTEVQERLCTLAERQGTDLHARAVVLSAVMKTAAQAGACTPIGSALGQKYSKSRSVELQQRCSEFQQLLKLGPGMMNEVLPADASCEDLEVDEELRMLDGFVAQALARGAVEYCKPVEADDDNDVSVLPLGAQLRFDAYKRPDDPNIHTHSSVDVDGGAGVGVGATGGGDVGGRGGGGSPESDNPTGFRTAGVKAVWGRPTTEQLQQQQLQQVLEQQHPLRERQRQVEERSIAPAAPVAPAAPAAASPAVPERRQPTEKEKMAAALFGGISGGPLNSNRSTTPNRTNAPTAAASARRGEGGNPMLAGVPAVDPTPTAAPGLLPVVDLLDISFDSSTPPSAPTPAAAVPGTGGAGGVGVGLFSGLQPSVSAAAAIPPCGGGATPAAAVDPFAMEGLLAATDVSMAATEPSLRLQPLKMITSDFGQRWGRFRCERKAPVSSCAVRNLDILQARMSKLGFYSVEAIARTSECIFAATTSDETPMLMHLKLDPSRGGAVVILKTGDTPGFATAGDKLQSIMAGVSSALQS